MSKEPKERTMDELRQVKTYGYTHPKTKVVSGILEDECSHLMKRFFIEQRNLNS